MLIIAAGAQVLFSLALTVLLGLLDTVDSLAPGLLALLLGNFLSLNGALEESFVVANLLTLCTTAGCQPDVLLGDISSLLGIELLKTLLLVLDLDEGRLGIRRSLLLALGQNMTKVA
ncbi:hypothetical protein HG531_006081 [Fusarium graminearum]|nr:hypothetical protein HG531_006081 [Fusarium graminearum]